MEKLFLSKFEKLSYGKKQIVIILNEIVNSNNFNITNENKICARIAILNIILSAE